MQNIVLPLRMFHIAIFFLCKIQHRHRKLYKTSATLENSNMRIVPAKQSGHVLLPIPHCWAGRKHALALTSVLWDILRKAPRQVSEMEKKLVVGAFNFKK